MKTLKIMLILFLGMVFCMTPVLAEYNRVYLLDLHYDNGEISLNKMRFEKGFSPDRKIQYGAYELEVISFGNNALYSFDFRAPRIYSDRSNMLNGEINGEVIDLKEADFTLIVPYFKDGKDIKIYREGNELFSTGISEYSIRKSPKRSFAWLYGILISLFVALIIFFVIRRIKQ